LKALVLPHSKQNRLSLKKESKFTYNVTWSRVRATIVEIEEQ